MEVIGALLGIGVAAAAPRSRLLRPVAKVIIKSGMAVTDATIAVAVLVTEEVGDLVAKVRSHGTGDEAQETVAADGAAADVNPTPDAATRAPAPPATAPTAADPAPAAAADDLTRISGIGPKAANLLHAAGITSYAQLATASVAELQAILDQAGPRYRVVDPSSWPEKAQVALTTPVAEARPFDDADLAQIDGIGPKVAALLRAAGIETVSRLAATDVSALHALLDQAGPRYRIIDPASWPGQAQALLAESGQRVDG
jgi:predicted flap endonuclease-1-like 5' DNA nuclease